MPSRKQHRPCPSGDVVRENEPPGEKERLCDLVYLGQAAGTYLVFAADAGIVLIDQHAAHERILFEQFKTQAAERQGRPPGQSLLLPEVISLPPRDLSFLIESIPILAEAGMEVEPFGGDSVVVKAVPALLSDAEVRTLIGDLIGECMDGNSGLPLAERRERIFTALACRAAVKANRRLSGPEVESLCRDLDALPGAATCPHGRPLTIVISREELEKRFKRR